MGQTPTYQLPYPELDDPDDVPTDMAELANRIEALLPGFQTRSEEGIANGYASLDATGKVPAAQLPGGAGGGTRLYKTTEKDVVNTTTQTDLFNGEITIPAAALTANGRLAIRAGGDYLNNSGSNKNIQIELRLGGLTLWNSGNSNAFATAATRRAWHLTAIIQALGLTTSQRATGIIVFNSPDVAAAGTGSIRLPDTTMGPLVGAFLSVVGNVNMSSAQPLALLATHSAAASATSIRLEHAIIEVS